MNHPAIRLLAAIVLALPCTALRAEEANPADAMMKRMRETLRSTMIQLQTAQAEVATLQAKQAENEGEIVDLKAKVTALTKKGDADKAAAVKAQAESDAKMANQAQELALLNQNLDKWKAGYKQAAQVANETEAKRSSLASKVVMLEREVAAVKVKNRELYRLGNEVLVRYEKFGLGNALLAREPFSGIARVKFETLVQDYADKLVDQKLKPEGGGTGEPPAAPAPTVAGAPPPSPAKGAPPANPPKPKS